jgi:hypothetical protein
MILELGSTEEGAPAPVGASRLGGMSDLPGVAVAGLEDQRLYVRIRKEDLAASRFDRCWTIMQYT